MRAPGAKVSARAVTRAVDATLATADEEETLRSGGISHARRRRRAAARASCTSPGRTGYSRCVNVPSPRILAVSSLVPALLLALALQAPAPEPVPLLRYIQRSIDRDGGAALERDWRATLRRNPNDPAALLAVGTFERARYRFERADSLFLALDRSPSPTWRAMAHLGMASWRALGAEPARADTLYERAGEFATRAGARDIEADAVLGLAQLRQRSRGVEAGQALLERWWGLLDRPTPDDSAQRLCLAGAMEEQRGDTTGVRRIAQGSALAERQQSWRIAGTCRLAEAQTAERRGYVVGAIRSARQALAHFERIRYDLGTALASQWLGYVLVRDASYAEARQLLERAIEAARVTRFESVEGWAHSGLAELHLTLGDLSLARRHAMIARESHARRGDLWGVATARRFEGMALEAVGELSQASSRYAEAISAFQSAGLPLNALPVLVLRALVQLRLGQRDSAEATIALGDRLGQTTEGWRTESAVLRAIVAMRGGQLALADSLLRSTRMARQWRAGRTQLSAVTIASREALLALRMNRMAVAESALSAVTAATAQWRGRQINAGIVASLAQLRDSWGGLSDVFPDIVVQLVARDRPAQAFALVEQWRARQVAERALRGIATLGDSATAARNLVRQGAPGAAVAGGAVAGIEQVQAALAPDEAFVTYVLGLDDVNSTAIVVTRDDVRTHTLPGRNALLADIRRVVQLAARGAEAEAAGRRLGNALLAPIFAGLPETVTRLLLSPDGELHRVPFDILRLPDGRFAVERATIAIAPSATALLALRRVPSPAGTRVAAFGDPRYLPRATPAWRGGAVGDRGSISSTAVSLPPLPHSANEARRVARFGRTRDVRLGAAASEAAVLATDWRDVAVAHFAVHALVDPEGEAGTALALTPGDGHDGFLTPGELAALELRGALVVLSACRSSGGQVLWGEGLRGLAAPLLEAGGRAVVATHWSIGDRSVVPFVDRFYAAMAAGRRVDDALRDAKLAAIRDRVSIADWGSFTVIGDGSLRLPLRQPEGAPARWLRGVTQVMRDSSGP